MVFSSPIFLFQFLPLLFTVYFLIKEKYYNITLLIFSLIFYAWGEPKNVFLMLISIGINYILARVIDRFSSWRTFFLVVSVVYNLLMLYIFKYFNFTVEILDLFRKEPLKAPIIALPIGISFFTFQIMSYVIDVYQRKTPVQKNILSLALYISLFPQLIAGPIVRYIDIEKQIQNRFSTREKVCEGILRFSAGFCKKVLIADQISPLVDTVFSGGFPSIYGNWIGMISYTIQIYFDFSGYSDMAIGLANIFGMNFDENFNYPYISKSITEFWRRWHITLSSWFKDYIYIPLGGNRKGLAKQIRNILIVWFLTGAWHGASWNFILWGLYFGVILILEKMFLLKFLEKIPAIFRHIYTIFLVLISWLIFAFEDLGKIGEYFKALFNFNYSYSYNSEGIYYLKNYAIIIIIGIILSTPIITKLLKKMETKNKLLPSLITSFIYIAIFIFSTSYLVSDSFNPFLYFRF